MRHLANGNLLIDETAIVVVFPLESTPSLVLTGTDPDDASRVVGSLRGVDLALLQQALLILGHPVMPADETGTAEDVGEPVDALPLIGRFSFDLDSAPVIAIILELERQTPMLLTNATTDEREARLLDWIATHPALRDLRDRAQAAQSVDDPRGDLGD